MKKRQKLDTESEMQRCRKRKVKSWSETDVNTLYANPIAGFCFVSMLKGWDHTGAQTLAWFVKLMSTKLTGKIKCN